MLSGRHPSSEAAMNETDKLVAAIFAATKCANANHNKHGDYIAEYDIFLNMLREREKALGGQAPGNDYSAKNPTKV